MFNRSDDAALVPAVNWKRNLTAVWISQYLSLAGFGLCMPFIPLFIKDHCGIVSDAERGVFVSAFTFSGLISLCIANAVWGMVADRFGRKLMLLRASFAAAVIYPLMSIAPDVYVLILIRFCASFFTGTVNPAQTLLVTTSPADRQGYVLGVLSTAVWGGNMTGYLIGGTIVHCFGYTAAFISCSALYLLSGLLVQFCVKENFVRPQRSPENSRQKKTLWKETASPGVIAILVMFILMGAGRRIDQPFVAMLVELIHGEKGAAFYTGIVSAGAAFGGVVAGFFFGRISDKIKPEKLLIPAVSVAVAAAICEAFSPNIGCLLAARSAAFLFGGGLQPMLLVMLSARIPQEYKGTFFGWSASINVAGGIIASLLSGMIVYRHGVPAVFLAGAGILALILIPAFILRRNTSK